MDGMLDLSGLRNMTDPPPLESLRSVRDAIEFNAKFRPAPETDYSWVWDYAKERYAEAVATYDALDEKAGEIIKYLGGGTGIITIAALANISSANVFLLFFAIPSFILAMASLYFAVLARRPGVVSLPPNVQSAIEYAERFNGEAKERFVSQWHRVCAEMRAVNDLKADRVQAAIELFRAAVVALALPYAVSAVRFGCPSLFTSSPARQATFAHDARSLHAASGTARPSQAPAASFRDPARSRGPAAAVASDRALGLALVQSLGSR